ncbi:hypothetical protein [Mycobacterium bourgelatii]|uniref:hypothetical protein n=1 Tax=Mycobacterium bourgelatii TaxID=1273442 RepID=UPI0013D44A51|nr:hypothetical protein [Mycobacterium bourgelatii]MCV6978375.1 hypothetical protein [Mycobacterium bourgelatii]
MTQPTDPYDCPKPCGIPREMMLEIMRERELQELREEQEYWERSDDPRAAENLRAITDRLRKLG